MLTDKDYYLEDGNIVFTEQYHLKRGYCCKNGCRHCPWKSAEKKQKRDKKIT
ncbi:DUF5522 domain-containing protein [Rubrolithibacter danxiaensis]|uniref:DUF5522 domain-containing protein n=1 Tax=Rubrolithibacter danxiaensis TaxID=3390805 RepID=UPI003BF878C6